VFCCTRQLPGATTSRPPSPTSCVVSTRTRRTRNYLKAAFDIGTDAERFEEQSDRFAASVRERHAVSTASLRHVPTSESDSTGFANVANFDPTSTKAFDEITKAFATIRALPDRQIPLVIGGEEIVTEEF